MAKTDVVSFVENNGINYTILYATHEVIQAYGNINAIPASFIMDKHGDFISKYVGLTPKEVYTKEIKKLLN